MAATSHDLCSARNTSTTAHLTEAETPRVSRSYIYLQIKVNDNLVLHTSPRDLLASFDIEVDASTSIFIWGKTALVKKNAIQTIALCKIQKYT